MEYIESQLFPCFTSLVTYLHISHAPPQGGEACLEAWSVVSRAEPGLCSSLTGIDDKVDKKVEILGLVENWPVRSFFHAFTVGMLSQR